MDTSFKINSTAILAALLILFAANTYDLMLSRKNRIYLAELQADVESLRQIVEIRSDVESLRDEIASLDKLLQENVILKSSLEELKEELKTSVKKELRLDAKQ
jgi:hypothetical protein